MKLDFGTAGIRGIVGTSDENLNEIYVAQIFDAYARYLIDNFSDVQEKKIIIGRDNRIKGRKFANIAAHILTSHGIKIYFNYQMLATPFVSFLTKNKKAIGAINITASHNPKEYNGIKLYNKHGSQMLPKEINVLKKYFKDYDNYKLYKNFKSRINKDLILNIEEKDYQNYINEIKKINYKNNSFNNLKIVYSSLHGTGYEYIKKLFNNTKINIIYEKNEIIEDENFTYVKNPNPEHKEAFNNSIKLANKHNVDLILITDPDSDRIGVAVRNKEEFVLINGNENAILITEYLIKNKPRLKNKIYYLLYSFVSTTLPVKMCLDNDIKSYMVETGFKWIANKINTLNKKEEFFFGFEESYGSLIDEKICWDKDAIQALYAITIIASMAKNKNKSLLDELESIYQKYGYVESKSFSFDLNNKEQLISIKNKFKALKLKNAKLIDYSLEINDIEKNEMLTYLFDDNLNWVSLRPSGTEPKIKIYLHIISKNKEKSKQIFDELFDKVYTIFKK